MDRLEDRDPRFRHLEKKVGAFVFIIIVGLMAVVFLVGREKDLFIKKYTLYATTDSGTGLIRGMPVKLSGFKIGRVKELSLDEVARVKVVIEANKKYQQWIRRGSVARLLHEGFIGKSVIEISAGDPSGPVLEEGDELPLEKARGVEELVKEMKPVLKEVSGIINYVNDPKGDVKTTLRNLKAVSSELSDIGERIDATLRGVSTTFKRADNFISMMDEHVEPMAVDAKAVIGNLESATRRLEPILDSTSKIASEVEGLTGRLMPITERTEKVLENLDALTGSLAVRGSEIGDMIEQSGELIYEGADMVRGIKQSWPVKLMMPPEEKPGLLPIDGADIVDGIGGSE